MCRVNLVAVKRNSPLFLKRLVLSARFSYFFPLQSVNKRKYSTKYYITDCKITLAGVKSVECVILFAWREDFWFVRWALQVTKTSLKFLSHCADWTSAWLISHMLEADVQTVDSDVTLLKEVTLSLLVCFVSCACAVIRSDGDLEVSHLGGGAEVTYSWPRCWTPGRRPWSGWREMNTQPLQLQHGSETLNPPAPTWTSNHTNHNRLQKYKKKYKIATPRSNIHITANKKCCLII